MTDTVSIEDFKKAIRIDDHDSVAQWMREQRNPEGRPVTRTNLYRAINEGTPQWLLDNVMTVIRKSKQDHPRLWESD